MKTKTTPTKTTKPTRSTRTTALLQNKGEGAFFRVQPSVKVGKPKSRFETEADQMAERAVNGGEASGALYGQISPVVQRKEDTVQRQEEEEAVQAEMEEEEALQLEEEEEEMLQPKEDEALQRQEAKEGEEKIQLEPEEEEEEMLQPKEDEALQRQEAEDGEEEMQLELEEEKEEMLQPKEEEEALQRQEAEGEGEEMQLEPEEEGEVLQPEEEEETLQAKRSPRQLLHRGFDLARSLRLRKGRGEPLRPEVRAQMESSFQADFSDVRIHTDQDSVKMNKAVGAKAFTTGKDIFFNQGRFDPTTQRGKLLLAHELTHTVQQGAVKEKKNQTTEPPQAGTDATLAPPTDDTVATVETVDTDALVGTTLLATSPATDSVVGTDVPAVPEEQPVPRKPEDDPNFQALKSKTKQTAKAQTTTPTATSLADNAGQAAPLADNEQKGQAQADQVGEMDRQEPQLFDATTFKRLLLEQIKKILPKNEEEADKFPESGKMDQVQQSADQQVASEKEKAGGAIKSASSKEPDPAAVPARAVAELAPPQPGAAPAPLPAGKTKPPARNNSEVQQPLVDNAQRMDNELAANEVTEEQLAKSEEPSFLTALDAKKTAKSNVETSVTQFRQEEQEVRDQHQQQAKKKGKDSTAGMFADRKGLLAQAAGKQDQTAKDNASERAAINERIDGIFVKTKGDVEKVLGTADGSKEGTIDKGVNDRFEQASKWATLRFESYIRRKMDAYKKERYGAWFDPRGWGKRVKDTFVGMPDEVNKFYVDAREKYIQDMDVALTGIAQYIATELGKVKKRIADGRQEVKDFVDGLPDNLQKLAREAVENIEDKFSQLDSAVTSKQDALIDTIAQKYKESLDAVDARIKEMKAANKGLVDKAMDAIKGVIETIKKLKKLITDLLAAIQSLMGVIMADPIGFMKALFAGIKAGMDNFVTNIKTHLIAGLFKWLTGALGPMGITLPKDIFSLPGIFSLVMQVLGLTWDFVRRKMVKLLTEPVVKVIEKGFTIVKTIREKGVMGLWEQVKQQFSDLKETVMETIQNMIITQVIQAGIKWVLSLLIPGAGFVKAIMAIKDVIVFFVESAIALIPTLISAIKAAAAKNFAGIAKAVEQGLSTIVPLVISLLAKLLGISGLVKKVQKIIKNIRKRIDRAVNKIIFKAKKWAKKVMKKAKKKAKKLKDKLVQWWKKKKKFKTKGGHTHELKFKGKGKNAKLEAHSKVFTILPVKHLKTKLAKAKVSKEKEAKKGELIAHATEFERLLGLKDTSKKEQDIQKRLDKTAKILVDLDLLDDSSQPPTKVTWTMNKGRAGKVVADPLSKQPGNTKGQNAKERGAALDPMWKFVTDFLHVKNKVSKSGETVIPKFVLVSADHLLNERYHGPATNWNLAIALDPINSTMQAGENKVTKNMLENDQVRYTAKASYLSNTKPSGIDINKPGKYGYAEAKPAIEFYTANSISLKVEKLNTETNNYDVILPETSYSVGKLPEPGKELRRKDIPVADVKAVLKGSLSNAPDAIITHQGKKYQRTISKTQVAAELKRKFAAKLDQYNTINPANLKGQYQELSDSGQIIVLSGNKSGTYFLIG